MIICRFQLWFLWFKQAELIWDVTEPGFQASLIMVMPLCDSIPPRLHIPKNNRSRSNSNDDGKRGKKKVFLTGAIRVRLMIHLAVCKKKNPTKHLLLPFASKKCHTQHLQEQDALTQRHYPRMSSADKDGKLRLSFGEIF